MTTPKLTARHITSPQQQGSCIGLPRKHAPPPTPSHYEEPPPPRKRTKLPKGVRRVEKAGRVKYEANVYHDRKLHYAGIADTPDGAARLYDAYVVAWGLNKPLNFPDAAESEGVA